ncbi:MAG: ABC transporter ATP-binding protein [Chitinophagaceae bacterium]|nr:ABC transporter ATP-binding protein [Chitinophagaceae bacterium]
MSASLLSIQNLSVDFINENTVTNAVQEISFSVNKGEIVAVVGESGSGKSVTALSILQLLTSPPAYIREGKIIIQSMNDRAVDMLSVSGKDLQQVRGNEVSMIFQEPMTSLNPLFTCGHQVAEAIKAHNKVSNAEARQQTMALFEKVRLPEPSLIYKRYPHQLSGGQKQRVMIAMAVSCNPTLLIADEPTTALDVTVQKNILQLIKELQLEKEIAVIFISHDLGLVAEIADRVIVMYKGKIVEENSAAALFKNPQHVYTKALLACRPAIHPKGIRLPVVSDFLDGNEQKAGKPREVISNIIMDHSQPLLEAKRISVWFPKADRKTGKFIKAVDDVSFNIYPGETLGLVGESGCGKTTLGRSLLRLVESTAGSMYYKGENLLSLSPEIMRQKRKELQIIFQDPESSLNPRITIGNAICEVLAVHDIGQNDKDRKNIVINMLEKVGLKAEHFNHYPHEFSGGQRQRVGIARALVLNPSFIICDESVSALDVSVQAQVLNLLNDLKATFGFSMLFISHDLSVIKYISDRIMVMYRGKIIETGNAEDIYNNPQNEYTRMLIAAIPKGI